MSNITQFNPCPSDPCLDTGNIDQCWRQINALKQIIADILQEMGGPIKTGPILGITDGSVALPGRVGEVMEANPAPIPFTGLPQSINVSAMVLQAGDWLVWTSALLQTNDGSNGIYNANIHLNPAPTGSSNVLEGWWAASTPFAKVGLETRMMTLNITVPTLLPFTFDINNNPNQNGGAGVVLLHVGARRMR
jgi:hypothetical protein